MMVLVPGDLMEKTPQPVKKTTPRALNSAVTPRGRGSRILLERGVRGRTARTVNLGLISPDAFSQPYPLLFEATMPRVDVCSDARDGDATSSDIRNRRPALKTRVSASACTDIRGNAMRWGSAIRSGQNFLVRRINCLAQELENVLNQVACCALRCTENY